MPKQYSIAEARGKLSHLIQEAEQDQRLIGQDDGLFEIPDDFDAPLPDEVLALFARERPSGG